jgi:hypothetical protein
MGKKALAGLGIVAGLALLAVGLLGKSDPALAAETPAPQGFEIGRLAVLGIGAFLFLVGCYVALRTDP